MKTVNTGHGGRRFYKSDVSVCMVPDCNKKAIYRHRRSERGYCFTHKDQAVEPTATVNNNVDGFVARFDL